MQTNDASSKIYCLLSRPTRILRIRYCIFWPVSTEHTRSVCHVWRVSLSWQKQFILLATCNMQPKPFGTIPTPQYPDVSTESDCHPKVQRTVCAAPLLEFILSIGRLGSGSILAARREMCFSSKIRDFL